MKMVFLLRVPKYSTPYLRTNQVNNASRSSTTTRNSFRRGEHYSFTLCCLLFGLARHQTPLNTPSPLLPRPKPKHCAGSSPRKIRVSLETHSEVSTSWSLLQSAHRDLMSSNLTDYAEQHRAVPAAHRVLKGSRPSVRCR